MSTGKTHNRVTLVSSITLSGFGLYHYGINSAIALLVGGLIGLVLTPDLDVDAENISYGYARKIKLEWLFRLIFKPYGISYKHRSNITHLPLFSTIIRLLYVYFPIIVIPTQNQHPNDRKHILKFTFPAITAQLLVVVLVWPITWFFWYYLINSLDYILLGFLSLVVSDSLHWLFDQLF